MSTDSSDEDYFFGQMLEHHCRTTTHTGTSNTFIDYDYYPIGLENSDLHQEHVCDYVKCDILYCGLNQELEWGLYLYFNDDDSVSSDKYFSVQPILIKNEFSMPVRASFEISPLNHYNGEIGLSHSFTVKINEKELQTLPTISKFLMESEDNYIIDESVTVHYNVTIHYEYNLVPGCILPHLFECFQPFLRDQKHSDVTLVTPNGVEIPAHKIILGSRSPVFESMFKNGLGKNQANILKIEDIESNILDDFLQCLYNCRSKFLLQDKPLELEAVCKLFSAADMYQVSFLKERCANHLEHNLCAENVCEIHVLADHYNEAGLKKRTLDFINRNSSTVICTPGWHKMLKTSPCSLVAELYAYKVENS